MITSSKRVRIGLYVLTASLLFLLSMWMFVYVPSLSFSNVTTIGNPNEIIITALTGTLLPLWVIAAFALPFAVGMTTNGSYIEVCVLPLGLHVAFVFIDMTHAFMGSGLETIPSFAMGLLTTTFSIFVMAPLVVLPSYCGWITGNRIRQFLSSKAGVA